MTAVTLARLSDVTSAILGAHGARVKRSADLSLGNNTLTPIAFTAEDHDTDTIHDNSTNNSRLTIPTLTGVTTGLWEIKASGYTNASSGRVDVAFRVGANGNPASGTPIGFACFDANTGGISGYSLGVDWVFTAGDYVECFLRSSGGTFSVIFDAGNSPIFSIAFLGKMT
jgi:hypothetical protein